MSCSWSVSCRLLGVFCCVSGWIAAEPAGASALFEACSDSEGLVEFGPRRQDMLSTAVDVIRDTVAEYSRKVT